MKKTFLIIYGICFLVLSANADKTIYVAPIAIGTKDGSSAANACTFTNVLGSTTPANSITVPLDATGITTLILPSGGSFTEKNGTTTSGRIIFPANCKIILEGNNSTLLGYTTDTRILRIGNGANVTLKNIIFKNGTHLAAPGAAIFFQGDYLEISNCIFDNNNSEDGGAITSRGKNVKISNSYFKNNKISNTNGVALVHTGTTSGGTLIVENTTFYNNTGALGKACYGSAICTAYDNYPNGGGTRGYLSSIDITNCTFVANKSASNLTQNYATVYLDELSTGTNSTTATFVNNTFYGNSDCAIYFAGIKQAVKLINNVIVGDSYSNVSSGGVYDNGIIAGSTSSSRPAITAYNNYIVAKTPLLNISEISNSTNGNTFVTTSSQSVIDGVYLNPSLSSTAIPYLAITNSSSPLLNVGISTLSGVTIPSTDMRGVTRGSSYSGSAYDIGAFELSTPAFSSNQNLSAAGISSTELAEAIISVASGELTLDQSVSVNSINVQPGAKLTLSSGSALTSGKIYLQSNGTGTATFVDKNSGVSTVSGNVQQYLPSARNWYVASPITTATVPASSTYFGYQEPGDNTDLSVSGASAYWKPYATGASLTIGKGYIAQPLGVTTLAFDGTLNTGSATVQLSRTTTISKPGYNLVGNPYPSYLDWSKVVAANTNVLPTAWFRTKKTTEAGGGYAFATVNFAVPASPVIVANDANTTITKYIPPMQAYWVQLVENPLTTNFTVTNAMRDHADNIANKFKAPQKDDTQLIRLRVSNGTNGDETVIYFNTNASDSLDRFDSPKMFNNLASVPEIYTQTDSEKLVINGMSSVKTDTEIPLGFVTGVNKTHTLTVTELKNLNQNTQIILVDKLQNTATELGEGVSYSFNADITPATTNRFSLLFRVDANSTGFDNTAKTTSQVFVNSENRITIITSSKCNYSVYNLFGQEIAGGQTNVNGTDILNISETGIYIVKILENSTTKILKALVK